MRELTHGGLSAGTLTVIPRWVSDPTPGVAGREIVLSKELAASIRRLAAELELPVRTLLLTAHAKVLAALTAQRSVVTGYLSAPGTRALSCPLEIEPGTWRSLALGCASSEALLHLDGSAGARLRGIPGGAADRATIFDPTGTGGTEVADGTEPALRFVLCDEEGRLEVHLRYRTDVLDERAAERVAGYYVTALQLMTDDPERDHSRQSLLSREELRFQTTELVGPIKEIPDRRLHELFEDQVRSNPDSTAVIYGRRQLTYRELNAYANRLARALVTGGLQNEGVAALVSERNIDWMAGVLAIFKAGGVYLPIEPHLPSERIRTMLVRSGCEVVLRQRGGHATLDRALDLVPDVRTLGFDDPDVREQDEGDLGIAVAPDQAAYIFFTSGSTGEPKGAMCEHLGMLNHVLAKIDDLAIVSGHVVAQTAPQSFDISLWQLVSALVVGGRTLVVDQDAILDVERFLDTIVAGRVNVLQVVPSYLEVILSELERTPRPLPDLRYVSVTGEELPMQLVRRWFDLAPDIKLVNAYGLTETSDDTNHEVMEEVPTGSKVPLGHPVNNALVYVLDENLVPAPLGSPGEICFSGICVGRGYINDPERTRMSFMADPHHEGARLYLSGDYGRWRPDGKLEFLGRRDSQVKINGRRIEIGEVESALSHLRAVRQSAVVVSELEDGRARLVAFLSGDGRPEDDELQDRLRRTLPDYMVPEVLHWRADLPLTGNGKIDRKKLLALAAELDVTGHERLATRTPAERWVAAAWSEVLGIPPDQIGRSDHFRDRGGTSLSAVKLTIVLDRALSLKDVTANPVLADQASLLERRPTDSARDRSSRTTNEGRAL